MVSRLGEHEGLPLKRAASSVIRRGRRYEGRGTWRDKTDLHSPPWVGRRPLLVSNPPLQKRLKISRKKKEKRVFSMDTITTLDPRTQVLTTRHLPGRTPSWRRGIKSTSINTSPVNAIALGGGGVCRRGGTCPWYMVKKKY